MDPNLKTKLRNALDAGKIVLYRRNNLVQRFCEFEDSALEEGALCIYLTNDRDRCINSNSVNWSEVMILDSLDTFESEVG